MLGEVLAWALRPFLARAAEVLQQRVAFDAWTGGTCPVCAGAPDLAQITAQGQRRLICERCRTSWAADPIACPYCGEADRDRITSLATPDGIYRVAACQTCLRYIKMVDSRHADRPALPNLDTIATLPLDAVVMQRGFSNAVDEEVRRS
jgi:FdhE protein